MAINQDIKALIPSKQIDADYLLQTLVGNGQLIMGACIKSGTTVESIEYPWLKAYYIPVPSLPEQRAIAAALSDTDALLSSLDRLLAKKRDIKQAVMQQLLTGKQRLPGFRGEWIDCPLGGLGTFKKGKGIKKDDVVSDGLPCIRYGEIYTRHHNYIKEFHSHIPRSIADGSQRLKKGDLLFAGSGETSEDIGKCVSFLGDEEAYAGGDIVLFSPVKQDSLYLGYLMNQPGINAQKSKKGQGDAVVHISAGSLAQLQISLPPLDEQTAIAAVLSDMDAEIDALQKRRDKTRAVKQGMMQELLTGRTRLV
jgi:type I restriction enzyme S subunit